jgi:transcriptional regulator with XRE-family HTH domain
VIKTERQYTTTRAQMERLAAALRGAESGERTVAANVDPQFFELERRGLESQIVDLRAELDAYDALRAAGAAVIPVESLGDLPRALIQARIAKGWTQADLAKRLVMAEQQVQRYEATDYGSASFARLQEIARALEVEVPSAVLSNDAGVTQGHFFRRLRELEFDSEVVLRKVLPSDLAEMLRPAAATPNAASGPDAMRAAVARAGSIVARVLDLDVAAFFSAEPLRLEVAGAGGPRFKQTATQSSRRRQQSLRGTPATADAYTVYAHYLALVLLEAHAHVQVRPIPDDARDVRRILEERYTDHGGVSLEGALHFLWDLGIPVLPLADDGGFHGACWRVEGRNVIVLKQRTRSFARWLFDLLHELRHARQHPEAADFAVVEREVGADGSEDEADAMAFAGDVLLSGRAEEITERAVIAAGGSIERLKQVVPKVAASEDVGVDSLANYLAHRLAMQGQNWWGAANNLQRLEGDPFVTARVVLLERADLSRINPIDRQLVMAALQGGAA